MTDNPHFRDNVEFRFYELTDVRLIRRVNAVLLIASCLVLILAIGQNETIVAAIAGIAGGWALCTLLHIDYIAHLEREAWLREWELHEMQVWCFTFPVSDEQSQSITGGHGVN